MSVMQTRYPIPRSRQRPGPEVRELAGGETHRAEGQTLLVGGPVMDRTAFETQAKRFTLFLLRVVSGTLFLQAGGMKLFDWFGGIPAEYGGHPAIMSQTWIGGVLEFYGGLAILLGLGT